MGVTMDQCPWGVELTERATWIGRFIYQRLGASADTAELTHSRMLVVI